LVHLQQVLLNIVANGMDAMSETAGNKQLTISTTNGDGVVHVSVADRGPGIPKDFLPQLFDRFFTTKKDGMGMGLSICKSLIEGLGGRIWAESVPGHGATFHFSLPVASVAARVRSAPESHLSPESHS
jgi:signal transduction histidine kinase